MAQKVIQIGSSFGITVAPVILETLGWRQGTRIELTIDERTNSLRVMRVQDGRSAAKKKAANKAKSSKKK